MPGEKTDTPIEHKEENSGSPIQKDMINFQAGINLSCLKKTIDPNENIKNGVYMRKDQTNRTHKSAFVDGKWTGDKPDKFAVVYNTKGEKQARAREREQTWKKPSQQPEDSEFINHLKEQDIVQDIKDSLVFYVPVEDGKGNTVKYEAMYVNKNRLHEEVINLPVRDIHGNFIRQQAVDIRMIPLEKPVIDPIDIISLGGGIWSSFAKGLTTLAPKVGINLSKVAVRKISAGTLFMEVILQQLPKEIFAQLVQNSSDYNR